MSLAIAQLPTRPTDCPSKYTYPRLTHIKLHYVHSFCLQYIYIFKLRCHSYSKDASHLMAQNKWQSSNEVNSISSYSGQRAVGRSTPAPSLSQSESESKSGATKMDATTAKANANKASKTKQNQRMSEAEQKIYDLNRTILD